jgi:hypothetical protein
MGSVSFRCKGYGMSEREAYANAKAEDDRERGYRDGYNGGMSSARGGVNSKCLTEPKLGKVKFKKDEHKVTTRAWETRYNVYYDIEYGRYDGWVGYKLTQGEAIELAKEYTTKHGKACKVVIEKVCTSYNSVVGVTHAEGATEGCWLFYGEAKE